MSAKTAKQTRGVRGWGVWTDRCICEDKLITAIRGGEGQMVPMSRGSVEVPEGQNASWHVKIVDKASVRGNIYIGVETILGGANNYVTRMGEDWYNDACMGRALYYSSDGDVCSGNTVVDRTKEPFGTGDVISMQTEQGTLSFCKNGRTIGKIEDVKGAVCVAVQLHRPGDKVLLLREHYGAAADRDILQRKIGEEEMAREREKREREKEEMRRRMEEEKAQKLRELQAERKRLEEAALLHAAILEEQRKNKEEEQKRKEQEELRRKAALEEERKRIEEQKRQRLAREEAARKKAAEEQIQKVARSRGGYYEEEPDPDAPSDAEMQLFLRNCLPLRLTAARQMGMPALPGASAVSQMQILLTPQQHYAVRSHLTKLNKTAKGTRTPKSAASSVGRGPARSPESPPTSPL